MSRRNPGGARVTNASDERQVRAAQGGDERQRQEQLDDLRAVLATAPGKRLLWRLMAECKVFGTVWDPSARIHYNAGRQDVGHFLMAEIEAADPGALWQMHQTVHQERASEAAVRVAERARAQENDDDFPE